MIYEFARDRWSYGDVMHVKSSQIAIDLIRQPSDPPALPASVPPQPLRNRILGSLMSRIECEVSL